ncbi:superinfection immunity protein [Hymenobacter guriensis]|uniref:superinfection immunity protein n=1 Tax=Hymenobacter guriensis TaxID=2793065 RepID=UPI0037422AFC
MTGIPLFILAVLIVIAEIYCYITPYIIASKCSSRFLPHVFIINVFFGWTLIGWILALYLALKRYQAPNVS